MSQPITIQYGAWSPDLQNVAQSAQLPVTLAPCADVSNVYYQDAAYRCLPGPLPLGPTLGSQVLNAWPWYDNVAAQSLLFAGTVNGISELAEGAWGVVAVENSISVPAVGFSLRLGLNGLTTVAPLQITLQLGSIGAIGGQLYSGTLYSGASGNTIGFLSGTCGSMSPASDLNGNTLVALETVFIPVNSTYKTFFSIAANVSQNYFTTLVLSTLSTTLLSNAATFTTGSGQSTWRWNGSIGLLNGGTYPVTVNR